MDVQEQAKALFEAGDFSGAGKLYESIPKLSLPPMLAYHFARIKEEIGLIKEATLEYKEIIDESFGTKAAGLANRRLLLIGSLYGGGEEIRKYAEARAVALGNGKLLKKIKRIKVQLSGNVVPQEILKIREVKEEFVDISRKVKIQFAKRENPNLSLEEIEKNEAEQNEANKKEFSSDPKTLDVDARQSLDYTTKETVDTSTSESPKLSDAQIIKERNVDAPGSFSNSF